MADNNFMTGLKLIGNQFVNTGKTVIGQPPDAGPDLFNGGVNWGQIHGVVQQPVDSFINNFSKGIDVINHTVSDLQTNASINAGTTFVPNTQGAESLTVAQQQLKNADTPEKKAFWQGYITALNKLLPNLPPDNITYNGNDQEWKKDPNHVVPGTLAPAQPGQAVYIYLYNAQTNKLEPYSATTYGDLQKLKGTGGGSSPWDAAIQNFLANPWSTYQDMFTLPVSSTQKLLNKETDVLNNINNGQHK